MHKVVQKSIYLHTLLANHLQITCNKKNETMATTKFFLDKRSGNAPYPLKLTITHEGKAVHLLLGVKLNPEQWDGVKIVKHPRAGMLNNQLIARKADIDCLLYEWERVGKLKGKAVKDIKAMLVAVENGEREKVLLFKDRLIGYIERKSKGTAEIYRSTLRLLERYCDIDSLQFEDITPAWLRELDSWLDSSSMSVNTRAIHYRNIRAIFNDAIDDELITAYPFRKFKIRTEETAKRSLTIAELRRLINWEGLEDYQRQYVDIFFLIFLLRGINLVDLCRLKKGDVVNGRIEYKRAKTHKLYSIKVEPEAMEIMERYKGEKYLLNILDRYSDYNFYKVRLNRELKRVGSVVIGKHGRKTIRPLFPKLSTYWARHTFATIAKNECDISMDMIADLLGHTNGMAVTNVYVRKDERRMDAAARKVIDKVLYDK